ncbi:MAG: hypothetical protein AB8B51_09090 [Sedimentitalea sp.]
MNKLPPETRAMILNLLIDGMSMGSVSHAVGVSINTVTKLLAEAGATCAAYHDITVRNISLDQVAHTEIWSFRITGDKAKHTPTVNVWTRTTRDPNSQLILTYDIAERPDDNGCDTMQSLKRRIAGPFHLIKNGCPPAEATTAQTQLVSHELETTAPASNARNTTHAKSHNASMGLHRFAQLSKAQHRKLQNHLHMLSLFFVHHNFVRADPVQKITPAMAAGVTDQQRDITWILDLIDAETPRPT